MSKWEAIDKLHSEFVSKLKEERLRQNLSQEKLAEKAGISRRAIGMIEAGEIKPTLYNCFRICSALGVNFREMI